MSDHNVNCGTRRGNACTCEVEHPEDFRQPNDAADPATALAAIIHSVCVYIDGEAALRHAPRHHLGAAQWALDHNDSGWHLTHESEPSGEHLSRATGGQVMPKQSYGWIAVAAAEYRKRHPTVAAHIEAEAVKVWLAAPEVRAITAQHRECGVPKYDGCFSHLPMAHCRACGCPWPCDVFHLAALREGEGQG